MASSHGPKVFQWLHAPGLRGFVGWSTSRGKNQGPKSKQEYGCCTNIMLDQNEDEVDSLKIFK